MAIIDKITVMYELDEAASAATALDSHTGGLDLTQTSGNIGSGAGVVGTARGSFLTNTAYFTRADNAAYRGGNRDFAIAAAVRLTTKPTAPRVVAKFNPTGDQREYELQFQAAADRFRWVVSPTGSSTTVTLVANQLGAPAVDTWYWIYAWHNAADVGGNILGIRVNNGTADTVAHTTGVFAGTADFQIGAAGVANHFDGLIDNVIFFDELLTDDEQTWLYNSGALRSYTDIVNELGAPPDPVTPIAASFSFEAFDIEQATSAARAIDPQFLCAMNQAT